MWSAILGISISVSMLSRLMGQTWTELSGWERVWAAACAGILIGCCAELLLYALRKIRETELNG
ncbi:hypothetical protein [Deinococcus arenicola]|nr:hypothetical protein [Deinococcus sp. ZS9-10]